MVMTMTYPHKHFDVAVAYNSVIEAFEENLKVLRGINPKEYQKGLEALESLKEAREVLFNQVNW